MLKLHYNFGPLPLRVSTLPSYFRATSWPTSRNSHEDHIPKDSRQSRLARHVEPVCGA
jgi:hypothetical protein